MTKSHSKRTKTKKKIRRRSDEKNLYYIIERDLDREVLFPGNSGWESQVRTKRDKGDKIDYIVNYDNKILGIDLKYDFPKPEHFEQLNKKYKNSLNAIYLAYPADRVGEALDIINNQNGKYEDFGLISIALFRSNCIRAAKEIYPSDAYLISGGDNGKGEYRYSYFFNDKFREDLKKSGLDGFDKKEKTLVEDVLDGKCEYFKLSRKQIKTLYYLIKLSDIYSPLKYFRDGAHGFGRFIDHKWDWSNLLETSLTAEISYGTFLNTVNPSWSSMHFRRKIANLYARKVKDEDKKEIEDALSEVREKKKSDIKENEETYLRKA